MLEFHQWSDYNNSAVMKYYYLSVDKQIQGPYSGAEIVSMQQDGIINENTLLAVAGDNRWRVASAFVIEANELECSTWNNSVAASMDHQEVPGQVYAQSSVGGIGKIFTWKGRLNRKKFFLSFSGLLAVFYLVVCSAGWVISPELAERIMLISSSAGNELDIFKELSWYLILYAYFLVISWPLLFFSALSLLVRRFHDIGLSAVWPALGMIFVFSSIFIEDFVDSATLLYILDAIVMSILLLVCLYPGKNGENKYGSGDIS